MTNLGTEASMLGDRLKRRLDDGKQSISEIQTATVDKTREAAQRTDNYVHDHAWKAIGVVAGLAFAAGFLFSRRNQEGIAAAVGTGSPEVQDKVQKLNTWEFVHSALPLGLFLYKAVQASRCARKGMM